MLTNENKNLSKKKDFYALFLDLGILTLFVTFPKLRCKMGPDLKGLNKSYMYNKKSLDLYEYLYKGIFCRLYKKQY